MQVKPHSSHIRKIPLAATRTHTHTEAGFPHRDALTRLEERPDMCSVCFRKEGRKREKKRSRGRIQKVMITRKLTVMTYMR